MNEQNDSLIYQEPNKLNKPHILVKIAQDRALTARDKKIYNIFIRELLVLNPVDFKNNEIRLSLTKISNILGITTLNDLYSSIEKLMKTIITFEDNDLRTRAVMISSYDKPLEIMKLDDDIEYNPHSLVIRFDTKLTMKILEYADKYAKIDLNDINRLKISHAITLYEIFIKSLGKYSQQKINISERELRKYLHLNDKYKDIKDFTKSVIKKSVEELNEQTKLTVTYKRSKIDNENVYKFEVSQQLSYTFSKFKKCILEQYNYIEFFFEGKEYRFDNTDPENKSIYFICEAENNQMVKKEKAESIYEFAFGMINKSPEEFIYKFIINKNINREVFNVSDMDENDYEELVEFEKKYIQTK